MDKSSGLDRALANRSRPKVNRRKDLTDEIKKDVIQIESLDVKTSRRQDFNKTDYNVKSLGFEDINLIRSTTRIEESIDAKLRQLCLDQKITKETWLEAAFVFLSGDPKKLYQVNSMARERLIKRKEIADLRRANSMKQRLEQKILDGK